MRASPTLLSAFEIHAPISPAVAATVLTPAALDFIRELCLRFGSKREELLVARHQRQKMLREGFLPDFLPDTAAIRSKAWQVAAAPADLNDRRVEITGPTEAKMMINALNSGAKVFMADFEDSLSPTWENVTQGQANLQGAVRRSLRYEVAGGKSYSLGAELATLVVRPRGWHLREEHVTLAGQSIPASLFDFGLYFFHNHAALAARQSGPYFYLPKLESHLEARLWAEVFAFSEKYVGIQHGTIRATVLIETILAAFEMDEILYELRDYAAGLNAGRWDYIFSIIKKFQHSAASTLPDRSEVTMTVPFMRAYSQLLVQTCHKRGAHAMGGMSAFIPNRRDAAVTERALAKVREDKEREAGDGFDGTWVAHPDLVPVAKAVFDRVLETRPHQKEKLRADLQISARELLDFSIPGGSVSEQSLVLNIQVALEYLQNWLAGTGAVAIHNLMEDVATAEISRAQLWQWLQQGVRLSDGRTASAELYANLAKAERTKLETQNNCSYERASNILDGLVLNPEFTEFLTLPAYEALTAASKRMADVP